MSDTVLKITRNGTGPSTRYTITPANPSKYNPSDYPKDESLFEDYTALGVNVQERDAGKVIDLMQSGDLTFETRAKSEKEPEQKPEAPAQEINYAAPVTPVAAPVAPVNTPVAPVVPPVLNAQPPRAAAPAEAWQQPAPRRTYTPSPIAGGSETGFRPTRNL